eukprot:403372926
MNSNNTVYSTQNDESYLGAIVAYFLIAACFFLIGRNYDRIRSEVQNRTTVKRTNKYSEYQKVKRTKDDEESGALPLVSVSKSNKEKYLEKNLEESKMEIKQLSSELGRMRQRDQSLTAENQILKSKLMNQQNDLGSTNTALLTAGQSTDQSDTLSQNHIDYSGVGSRDNPIHQRYEEFKSSSYSNSNTSPSNVNHEKGSKKNKKNKNLPSEESPQSDEDVVNEIDTFLIEDEDL